MTTRPVAGQTGSLGLWLGIVTPARGGSTGPTGSVGQGTLGRGEVSQPRARTGVLEVTKEPAHGLKKTTAALNTGEETHLRDTRFLQKMNQFKLNLA